MIDAPLESLAMRLSLDRYPLWVPVALVLLAVVNVGLYALRSFA